MVQFHEGCEAVIYRKDPTIIGNILYRRQKDGLDLLFIRNRTDKSVRGLPIEDCMPMTKPQLQLYYSLFVDNEYRDWQKVYKRMLDVRATKENGRGKSKPE